MSSTACSCIGLLRPGAWIVQVADPHCRWHGDPEPPYVGDGAPNADGHVG